MDNFLKLIKNNPNEIKHSDAEEEIIGKLMNKKLTGEDKIDGFLEAYDSESNFKGQFCLGHIYIFNYQANKPVIYSYKGQEVAYVDTMPVVLLTGLYDQTIRGINLNFCNKGLKTIILNTIMNIDENFFFNGGDIEQYNKNDYVFSRNVYQTLINETAERQLIQRLNDFCKGVDYQMIFRNYSKANIKDLRMIEPWQWEYIPFLNYQGSLKKDTLEAIQTISGIKQISI